MEKLRKSAFSTLSKKLVKNLMPSFFKNKISDEEYRRALARFEALSDERLPDSLQKETDSAVERYSIISTKDKRSGDPLPTAPGYISIGAQTPEKN